MEQETFEFDSLDNLSVDEYIYSNQFDDSPLEEDLTDSSEESIHQLLLKYGGSDKPESRQQKLKDLADAHFTALEDIDLNTLQKVFTNGKSAAFPTENLNSY